eukprot:Gb_38781 [translate_table: standard]
MTGTSGDHGNGRPTNGPRYQPNHFQSIFDGGCGSVPRIQCGTKRFQLFTRLYCVSPEGSRERLALAHLGSPINTDISGLDMQMQPSRLGIGLSSGSFCWLLWISYRAFKSDLSSDNRTHKKKLGYYASSEGFSNIVSSKAELMVREEQRHLIILIQKMAVSVSLYYYDEATSKDIIPILCLKPILVDASYKRRACRFNIKLVHCTPVETNRKHLHKCLVKMKTVASASIFSTVRAPCEKASCLIASHPAFIREKTCMNWSPWCGNVRFNYWNSQKKMDLIHQAPSLPAVAATALSGHMSRSTADFELLKNARKMFCDEVSFRVKDRDVSLAKAMLLIAAEDEAYMSLNRDMDARSVLNEGREPPSSSKVAFEWANLDALPLAGKSISAWLSEFDIIAKEVEAELVSKEIGCHLAQVLEAVNVVLFNLRCFTRSSVLKDPTQSYLHSVLSSASGSAIMLSIIYIEVCRRLGVTIVGAKVGEDFLIWPQTENTEELFKLSEGESWFTRANGSCVKHPGSKASDMNSRSLPNLELGSNREIIGIALANLKRLYWKRASRAHPGLLLTSPLRPVRHTSEKPNKVDSTTVLTLRPQELR